MKYLSLLLFLIAAAPAAAEDPKPAISLPATAPGTVNAMIRNVNPGEFDSLRSGTNVVILDVRTPAEFVEGHLPGAVLVDYKSPDFLEKAAKLDKSKTYLVHCAAGVRSAKACSRMAGLGFTNLINLEGGLGAWKEAGKPVTK